jgi:hypothetical protein
MQATSKEAPLDRHQRALTTGDREQPLCLSLPDSTLPTSALGGEREPPYLHRARLREVFWGAPKFCSCP